jgi:hypothetical protein
MFMLNSVNNFAGIIFQLCSSSGIYKCWKAMFWQLMTVGIKVCYGSTIDRWNFQKSERHVKLNFLTSYMNNKSAQQSSYN